MPNKFGISSSNYRHGKRYTRLWNIYANMKARCNNENNPSYKYYGDRGIKIFGEWADDFMSFYNWSMNNGYEEDLSIDRIDNSKGYYPENCRWADHLQQVRNSRHNNIITAFGESKCISEWCEDRRCRVTKGTITSRLKFGLSPEVAITAYKNKLAPFTGGKWQQKQ